jgi:hypothetical protein
VKLIPPDPDPPTQISADIHADPDPKPWPELYNFVCGKGCIRYKKKEFSCPLPGNIRSAGLAEADPGVPSVLLGTAAPLRAQAPRISFIQLKDEGLSLSQKGKFLSKKDL